MAKKHKDKIDMAMTLRLPKELHRRLQQEADEFSYSLTRYIIELLDERHETVAKIRYRIGVSRRENKA